jgi:hypothetical protein
VEGPAVFSDGNACVERALLPAALRLIFGFAGVSMTTIGCVVEFTMKIKFAARFLWGREGKRFSLFWGTLPLP